MEAARLCSMAGQIIRNFAVQGEDEAVAATAAHISQFWDRRMTAQLLAVDRAALEPLVARVVDVLAQENVAG